MILISPFIWRVESPSSLIHDNHHVARCYELLSKINIKAKDIIKAIENLYSARSILVKLNDEALVAGIDKKIAAINQLKD